ncbi:UNVERIFIED_CONTAM: hypothetical protein FKN15_034445 [Acipenser sinensis]
MKVPHSTRAQVRRLKKKRKQQQHRHLVSKPEPCILSPDSALARQYHQATSRGQPTLKRLKHRRPRGVQEAPPISSTLSPSSSGGKKWNCPQERSPAGTGRKETPHAHSNGSAGRVQQHQQGAPLVPGLQDYEMQMKETDYWRSFAESAMQNGDHTELSEEDTPPNNSQSRAEKEDTSYLAAVDDGKGRTVVVMAPGQVGVRVNVHADGRTTPIAERFDLFLVLLRYRSNVLRDLCLLGYFSELQSAEPELGPALPLHSFTPYQVPMRSVALRVVHCDVAPSHVMYAVNASLVGVLRGVDVARGLYFIVTPLSAERLRQVNCLLVGSVALLAGGKCGPAPGPLQEPGDQIVGATIYFDNMSSEETSELLKTLNRHTSGDDEDYRRIYTKKIKPRLKSEDLAESSSVEVQTERHGGTVTTVTRKITTYTVDMPGSERHDITSPEFKVKVPRHDGSESSEMDVQYGSGAQVRIPHGFTIGGASGGSNTTVTRMLGSTETHWGAGGGGGGDIRGPKMDFGTSTLTTDLGTNVEGSNGKSVKFRVPGFSESTIQGPDVKLDGSLGALSGGTVTTETYTYRSKGVEVPSLDVTRSGASGRRVDGKLETSTVEFKGPSVDVPKMPSVSVSGFDLNGKGAGGFAVSAPKLEGDVKSPKVDIKAPTIKTSVGGGDVKMPAVEIKAPSVDIKGGVQGTGPSMPYVELSGQKVSAPEVDINLKGAKVSAPKISGDIKAPAVDVKAPGINVGMSGVKLDAKTPKVEFSGPEIKGPDFSASLPKADINVPKMSLDASSGVSVPGFDIKGPKLQGDIKAPALDIQAPDVNVQAPGIDIGGLEGSFKGKLPSCKGPSVSIEAPGVDIKGPEGGFKMPKLPKFGISGPTIESPDVDVKGPKGNVVVKGPQIDIQTPGADIKGPSGKMKGPGFKLPDFDVNLKGQKVKGDVDVSGPKIEGDLKGPKVDIDAPHVDIEGPEGGFKMPKFKMPTFGIKGPKVEGPDVDVNLPKGDIDIKGPKIEGDLKAPKVDIKAPDVDIEVPSGKVKGPGFKMPSMSGPNISMPSLDFNLKGPKVKGDMDVSVPKIEGDFKGPKVDIGHPDIDIKGPDSKIKGPGFKMPTISGPDLKMPSLDFNLKGPKVKGDVDVSVPKIEGDFKGPKVDIGHPDIDIKGPDSKIKGPGFKMPTISGPDLKMPSLDFNLKGPKVKGDVDVPVPKIEGDFKGPKVDIGHPDIDIKGPDSKIKGPGFKMPTISGPDLKMPSLDFNLKGPKVKGDVDVPVPKIEGDFKGPKVDIGHPDIDIKGPDSKIKGPGFKMPTISGPDLKMPSLDFNLKGPKVKGDVDVPVPKIEGDFKGPKVDIGHPDIDIKGPDSKIKGPGFKMPTISGPDLKMPSLDFNLKGPKVKGDVDVPVPKIEGDFKGPKQQEILTKSGEWFFGRGPQPSSQDGALSDTATCGDAPREKKVRLQERSRSQTPLSTAAGSQEAQAPIALTDRGEGADMLSSRSRSEPPRDRKKPTPVQEQNRKGGHKTERKRVPKIQQGERQGERQAEERRESRRLEKGRSQDYQDMDEESRKAKEEKQRKEEEFQTPYQSDPNLARYPVKPQTEEQQMRFHVKVSKARHERRHSDVALANTEMVSEVPENRLGRRSQQLGAEDRKTPMENQRSYSIERTGDVQISVSKKIANHSPPVQN